MRRRSRTDANAVGRMPLPERFWARVSKEAHPKGCWIWTGTRDGNGYGVVGVGNGKRIGAHRFSLELILCRDLNDDECACHRCDVPLCVRPDHLFPGSRADNLRDMWAKGRAINQAHPEKLARGERVNTAKLNASKIIEIRALYRSGASRVELAARFRVTDRNIWDIVTGRSWRHVKEAA